MKAATPPDLRLLARTARQIMDRQQGLRENAQAIEDVICQMIDMMDRQTALIEKHELRIRQLERRRLSPTKPKEKN